MWINSERCWPMLTNVDQCWPILMNVAQNSKIIEKSTETSAKQCISKEKFEQSLKVHTKCAKSVNKLRYVKILHLGGVPPPRFRNNIFWQILHTFCLLFNLFWTFPLKSIGFLRFQLIFRWFFNDFSGFSAYFQDILQRLCGRPKKYKNPPLTSPHKNLLPWDHAQMIERKILFRIALTRALYDQIRP